ncbi:MAG: hypothetical protein ACI8SK_001675 [Shewanella sp.]|jgi:uncharacterized protein (DUF1697 family)
MNRYIILLRGVNVGGNNILPMKELKYLLESNSFENVAYYIQSGNLVLRGDNHPEKKIADLIEAKFDFRPEVLALTESEFNLAVVNCPYQEYEGKFVHFYFCKQTPTIDNTKLLALVAETEQYELIDNVFYLHAPDGIGRSKLVANIESFLGVSATGRNLNSIKKLYQMVAK